MACLLALQGTVVARSLRGERRIAADHFFAGLYTTELAPDEVIVACEIPVARPDQKFAFTELARRHGDYAVVGLAASISLRDGLVSEAYLAWIGVGSTPLRSRQAEQALMDKPLHAPSVANAVQVLRAEIQPLADLTHSDAAKKQLAGVLLRRAMRSCMPGSEVAAVPTKTALQEGSP